MDNSIIDLYNILTSIVYNLFYDFKQQLTQLRITASTNDDISYKTIDPIEETITDLNYEIYIYMTLMILLTSGICLLLSKQKLQPPKEIESPVYNENDPALSIDELLSPSYEFPTTSLPSNTLSSDYKTTLLGQSPVGYLMQNSNQNDNSNTTRTITSLFDPPSTNDSLMFDDNDLDYILRYTEY
ncbi:unnamed protein product [Candida verbasci]|uniref:Uncharacterized protein n=1 Tax=Candida verbasci TaxID=1227364 RepID=A0A9W4TZU9_9ASCO|nr:unnamed protein product [Candida verbasci]